MPAEICVDVSVKNCSEVEASLLEEIEAFQDVDGLDLSTDLSFSQPAVETAAQVPVGPPTPVKPTNSSISQQNARTPSPKRHVGGKVLQDYKDAHAQPHSKLAPPKVVVTDQQKSANSGRRPATPTLAKKDLNRQAVLNVNKSKLRHSVSGTEGLESASGKFSIGIASPTTPMSPNPMSPIPRVWSPDGRAKTPEAWSKSEHPVKPTSAIRMLEKESPSPLTPGRRRSTVHAGSPSSSPLPARWLSPTSGRVQSRRRNSTHADGRETKSLNSSPSPRREPTSPVSRQTPSPTGRQSPTCRQGSRSSEHTTTPPSPGTGNSRSSTGSTGQYRSRSITALQEKNRNDNNVGNVLRAKPITRESKKSPPAIRTGPGLHSPPRYCEASPASISPGRTAASPSSLARSHAPAALSTLSPEMPNPETSVEEAATPSLAPLTDLVLGFEGKDLTEAQLASSLEEAQEAAKRVLEQLDMEKRLLDEQLIVDIGHAQSQKEILEELKMAAPGCVETESFERHDRTAHVEYQSGATSPLLQTGISDRQPGSPLEFAGRGELDDDPARLYLQLAEANLQLAEAHTELEDAYKQLDEARAEQLQGLEHERVLADERAELQAEVQRLGGGAGRYSGLLQLLALPEGALTFRVGRVEIARSGGEGDAFEDVEVVLREERLTLRQQDGVLCHLGRKDAGFGASLGGDESEVVVKTEAWRVTVGITAAQSREGISVPGLLAAWGDSRPGLPDA